MWISLRSIIHLYDNRRVSFITQTSIETPGILIVKYLLFE